MNSSTTGSKRQRVDSDNSELSTSTAEVASSIINDAQILKMHTDATRLKADEIFPVLNETSATRLQVEVRLLNRIMFLKPDCTNDIEAAALRVYDCIADLDTSAAKSDLDEVVQTVRDITAVQIIITTGLVHRFTLPANTAKWKVTADLLNDQWPQEASRIWEQLIKSNLGDKILNRSLERAEKTGVIVDQLYLRKVLEITSLWVNASARQNELSTSLTLLDCMEAHYFPIADRPCLESITQQKMLQHDGVMRAAVTASMLTTAADIKSVVLFLLYKTILNDGIIDSRFHSVAYRHTLTLLWAVYSSPALLQQESLRGFVDRSTDLIMQYEQNLQRVLSFSNIVIPAFMGDSGVLYTSYVQRFNWLRRWVSIGTILFGRQNLSEHTRINPSIKAKSLIDDESILSVDDLRDIIRHVLGALPAVHPPYSKTFYVAPADHYLAGVFPECLTDTSTRLREVALSREMLLLHDAKLLHHCIKHCIEDEDNVRMWVDEILPNLQPETDIPQLFHSTAEFGVLMQYAITLDKASAEDFSFVCTTLEVVKDFDLILPLLHRFPEVVLSFPMQQPPLVALLVHIFAMYPGDKRVSISLSQLVNTRMNQILPDVLRHTAVLGDTHWWSCTSEWNKAVLFIVEECMRSSRMSATLLCASNYRLVEICLSTHQVLSCNIFHDLGSCIGGTRRAIVALRTLVILCGKNVLEDQDQLTDESTSVTETFFDKLVAFTHLGSIAAVRHNLIHM